MEPPTRMDRESVRDEKVKVLKSIAPMTNAVLVRVGNLWGISRNLVSQGTRA
jgi:glucose-6-phosphate 1-dehydrogenase